MLTRSLDTGMGSQQVASPAATGTAHLHCKAEDNSIVIYNAAAAALWSLAIRQIEGIDCHVETWTREELRSSAAECHIGICGGLPRTALRHGAWTRAMSDLKADTKRIRECSRALHRIYESFTTRANPIDDYSSGELGNQHIVDAFGEFADNWKIHREDLAEKIKTLGIITEKAARSYDALDAELARALRRQDAKRQRHGGAE